MLGTTIKVFEFEDGETDWVMAETLEDARLCLEECIDVNPGCTILEVSIERLKKLKYRDEYFRGSFFQQYLRLLISEEEFPRILASSAC